ncbi:small oligopeptide transporter [Marasmius fiardii PR-910]|nr:small oligopeptide transporter [Marasmius fiardii PR-910]
MSPDRYPLRMQSIPEVTRADESSGGLSGNTIDGQSIKGSDLDSLKSCECSFFSNFLSIFKVLIFKLNEDRDDFDLEDDSPYPEVRSAVANTDDPTMPVSTIRAWAIGIPAAILFAGVNQFFMFRYPSISFTTIVPLLLSYPVGRAAAAFIPRNWTLFGYELNPGPFSIKEHVLITASVASESAYATDIVAVQRVYYNQVYNFSYQWFLVMSTQLIGFSIGGIARRILVDPPSMIWPTNLVTCALFNALHSEYYTGAGTYGGMSRQKYFWLVFGLSFAWFRALSYFSWVTWIWPENVVIAQLFGYINGLGLSIFTFDWNQIAYVGSPLVTPWWAQANVIFGFIFFYWIITPILYFKNVWFAQYMPILNKMSFDNTYHPYDVQRILKPDMTFDLEAYKNYSPLFLSLVSNIRAATLSHTFIYYRKQIWNQARRSLREQPDIHARLMSHYPQVPDWWYYIVFVVPFALGVISIELWPTHMPVWALVLAIMIAMVYVVPVGIVQAITNQKVALNVITELIIGYALPGRPVAMLMFKTWGYITMAQAMVFTGELKLGHYMKVPPRAMFWAQVIGTILAGTTQLGVQSWMFSNIPKMCDLHQPDGFTCPFTAVFGVSSIIVPLVYFFLIGAIAPVIPWLISKRYPHSFMKYIHPIVFAGTNLLPPATAVNFVPSAIVGFIFQYLIRRYRFSWWEKYNYILSAALDAGVAFSVILIFFALQYPKNGTIGKAIAGWWGNTVPYTGADGHGTPVRVLSPGETFG